MKENKKAILEILKKKSKKDGKFENLVLNLALQKIDSDNFEFDGGGSLYRRQEALGLLHEP